MFATCRHAHGADLGPAPERGDFWTPTTDFAAWVTRGRDYVVMGLGMFDSVLLVLIRGDDGLPGWFPVALFDIPPGPLPADWAFALRDGLSASGARAGDDWQAVWGYPELVRDARHSDGLVERETEHLRTFRRRWEAAASQ